MAITENTYTGTGFQTLYSITFPYLERSDVRASLNGVNTTAFTFANATTIQFNTAPGAGVAVRLYRVTDVDNRIAEFYPGSAIRASDLNDNFDQTLYVVQENTNYGLLLDGSSQMAANLNMNGYKVINHGTPTQDTDAATKAYVDLNYGGSTTTPNVTRWAYTSNGSGETVLTGTMSGQARYGGSLSFTDGNEQVFLNGAFLERNVDYTTNGVGTSITLTVALIDDDVIEVRSYNNLPTYDIVSSTVGTTKWRKVATGGQTLFSGTGDVGGTLQFAPNREQVYVNGALQQHNGVDYTPAVDGLSVTFATGLTAGDVVDIRAYNNSPTGPSPTSLSDLTFDSDIDLVGYSYYVNGNEVLNQTTLGSTVLNSSLTSVGTISTGVWQGTAINATYLDPTLVQTTDTGTVTSTMIANDTIVNADISGSASIAYSKLAPLTSGNILVGNSGNTAASVAMTGDVTISNTGVTSISSGVIVNADVSATAEIAVSKLANGTARQLLQTDVAGTGVEWTTNVDIPGTLDVTGAATFDSNVTIADGQNIVLGTTTGTKIGTATTQKLGFFNATPVVQPTALTTQLTTITFVEPTTPDYAIQTLATGGTHFGFATLDEGLTVLKVIANLQARVGELETKLQSLGIIA